MIHPVTGDILLSKAQALVHGAASKDAFSSGLATKKFRSVAPHRLATGVGDLDWKDVEALVAKHLEDLSVSIYAYTPCQKWVAAAESD
jgi:O-acetyl-ADP-ribose deacetylase (regulator of RNase III)